MLKENYDTEPTEIDTLVFEKLVPPEHYLRQVKRLIDFERFRDLVQDCYRVLSQSCFFESLRVCNSLNS